MYVPHFIADLAAFVANPRRVTEAQYKERLTICQPCDKRVGRRCHICKCLIGLRARGKAFDCPLGKWPKANES